MLLFSPNTFVFSILSKYSKINKYNTNISSCLVRSLAFMEVRRLSIFEKKILIATVLGKWLHIVFIPMVLSSKGTYLHVYIIKGHNEIEEKLYLRVKASSQPDISHVLPLTLF